jgi:hypothetical protein
MRVVLLVLGVVLLLGGGYALFEGLSVTTQRDTMRVGPLSATVDQKRTVPPWLGGLAAVAGVALIIVGARTRS